MHQRHLTKGHLARNQGSRLWFICSVNGMTIPVQGYVSIHRPVIRVFIIICIVEPVQRLLAAVGDPTRFASTTFKLPIAGRTPSNSVHGVDKGLSRVV